MTVLHKNLSSTQLHDSKGLSASSDKEYNHAVSSANSWGTLIAAQSGTASASSELDIINLSGYNTLIITFQDILPAASGIIQIRFSSDNGSSFDNSAIYYAGFNQDGTSDMQSGFTQLNLDVINTTNYVTGKIIISNFNQAVPSGIYGHVAGTAGSNYTTNIASKGYRGFVNSATAWNAVRVYNSGGNITSGKVIVEGIKS